MIDSLKLIGTNGFGIYMMDKGWLNGPTHRRAPVRQPNNRYLRDIYNYLAQKIAFVQGSLVIIRSVTRTLRLVKAVGELFKESSK